MSDAALDEAKKEALDDDEVENLDVEEAVEEEVEIEEEIEEEIDEVLPQNHKERSNLGRKVSALLNKSDKMEEIMVRQQETIELLGNKIAPPAHNYEDDEPMTKGEFKQMEAQKGQRSKKYTKDFQSAFHTLSENMSEDDKENIGEILLNNYNVKSSENGTLDGAKAFQNASLEYYGKKTPLQGKKTSGVITKQTVKHRGKSLEKLDSATQSYYNSIVRDRGKETADRLHKEL